MPSGLARLDATLATVLARRDADRAGEPGLGLHALADRPRDLGRGAVQAAGARHVEEGLVDRQRLDQRRDLLEDAHDLLGVLRVARVVAPEHHRVGAPLQSDRHRHGRVHAEPARLVARRRDHAAASGAADEHGLATQVGSLEQLDGHEERVHVDVQDRVAESSTGPVVTCRDEPSCLLMLRP
jgi:hypothetical protein